MSLSSSVGIESGSDAFTTAVHATHSAVAELGHDPSLVLVFASTVYDQEQVILGVRSVAKYARIAGCSSAGEISTRGPSRSPSIVVLALYSETVQFHVGVGEGVAQNARLAGKVTAQTIQALASEPVKTLFLFSDVLVGSGTEILQGVFDVLSKNALVLGGGAADNFSFTGTYQYCDDRVYTGACVGVGMVGEYSIGVGVEHGWVPIGIPKKITNSVGHRIHEIDGKPAVEMYKDYFGEELAGQLISEGLAKMALTYPLGLFNEQGVETQIIIPLRAEPDGTIVCMADVPLGYSVQLMIGSGDEVLDAAKKAAQQALTSLGGKIPRAVLLFSSAARFKLLGDRVEEEVTAVHGVLGPTLPLAGFYTYGEYAPQSSTLDYKEHSTPTFHNETLVVVALSD